MTMQQIRTAWSHTTNGGGVQKEYPDQMAKRTVINRGAKMYVNTSDDDDTIIEAINRTTESEYQEPVYTDFTSDNGEEVHLPQNEALPAATKQEDADVVLPAEKKIAENENPQREHERTPNF